jgi:hypothetical protein
MYASGRGHEEAVRLLLHMGANRYEADSTGRTAQDFAKAAGHTVIEGLLSRADIGDVASQGRGRDGKRATVQAARPVSAGADVLVSHSPTGSSDEGIGERRPLNGMQIVAAGSASQPLLGVVYTDAVQEQLPLILQKTAQGDKSALVRIRHEGQPEAADAIVALVGREIPSTGLELVSVTHSETKPEIMVKRVADGQRWRLPQGRKVTTGVLSGTLSTADGGVYDMRVGDTFTTQQNPHQRWTVSELNASQVLLENRETRDRIVLPRQGRILMAQQ